MAQKKKALSKRERKNKASAPTAWPRGERRDIDGPLRLLSQAILHAPADVRREMTLELLTRMEVWAAGVVDDDMRAAIEAGQRLRWLASTDRARLLRTIESLADTRSNRELVVGLAGAVTGMVNNVKSYNPQSPTDAPTVAHERAVEHVQWAAESWLGSQPSAEDAAALFDAASRRAGRPKGSKPGANGGQRQPSVFAQQIAAAIRKYTKTYLEPATVETYLRRERREQRERQANRNR